MRAAALGTLFATRAPIGRRSVEARSLHALAALLALVLLPHLAHLPPWVSAVSVSVVALRLLDLHRPGSALRARLLSPLALSVGAAAVAFLIRADYGYFLGRDPCVAFLAVLVAAKFAEVRRASDTTLLLCLAAFLLLTQYFYSQTILAALVTLPAVVALGHALSVLRDPNDSTALGPRLALVGKLLVQGLPIAALLFVLFPRLPGPLWSLPEDSMGTTGLSDSMEPGSIGSLSQSDEVAFRVEFDDAVPPSRERYWRGPVLDRFDGRRWSIDRERPIARPPAVTPALEAARVDYTVMLQPNNLRWLFALEQPLTLPRASDAPDAAARPLAQLTDDGQLLADKPVSRVLRYRQSSVPSESFRSDRAPAPTTLALAGRNPRSEALAEDLRARSASDGDYARAVLERFNRESFRYTLSPQLLGDAPVDEFLFDTRAGFCEHYASAFVVLMRAAGIPARVVTGYQGGEMNGDYMIVRQSDAHAWAEAWIDGAWRRFDPTAAVAPSRVESGLASALPDSALIPRLSRTGGGWLKSAGLSWDRLNHAWQRLVVDFDDDSQDALWERLGLPEPALWQLVVAVLGGAGLWCLAVLGLPGRRERRALAPAERAWARFGQALERRGVVRGTDESPAEYVARAVHALPDERAVVERLGAALLALRFARPDAARDAARLLALRRELGAFAVSGLARRRRRADGTRANGGPAAEAGPPG